MDRAARTAPLGPPRHPTPRIGRGPGTRRTHNDRRAGIPAAKALGVLLRSILVEREAIYRQQGTVEAFTPAGFGLSAEQAAALSDDQVGRALDRLFDADREALLTQVVVGLRQHLRADLTELHNDSTTQIQAWDTLCAVAGRPDFLYLADSKLCSMEARAHLDRHHGRSVTVLPRSRQEDAEFRRWIESNDPDWQLVIDRVHPRHRDGPRDRWWVFRPKLPSREGWPVTWVKGALLALAWQDSRRDCRARAADALDDLVGALASPRTRRRERAEVEAAVAAILDRDDVRRYIRTEVRADVQERFVQVTPGRPGRETRYRRVTRSRPRLTWSIDEAAIAYDHKSDGISPLLTNDRALPAEEVLLAHKRQPTIEKRFEQLKDFLCIAPVFLKNEDRIEAFFLVHYLALLVSAVIERELRAAMNRQGIPKLPLYPEARSCRRPTTEQVLRLFSRIERHVLTGGGAEVQVFPAQLTGLHRQVLALLGIPASAYADRH